MIERIPNEPDQENLLGISRIPASKQDICLGLMVLGWHFLDFVGVARIDWPKFPRGDIGCIGDGLHSPLGLCGSMKKVDRSD